jgi:hypothetical protein
MNDGAFETIDKNQERKNFGTPLNQNCVINDSTTTSALHARRKITKAPLVGTIARRSIRLEGKTKGFRCDASNSGRDCSCCAIEPPNLSGKAIRSLGKIFCKILVAKMTEEGL